MGLERGGFILMISHYGRAAILGYFEIHYIYFFLFYFFFFVCVRARTHINLANKRNKTAREKGGKKEKETKPGRAKNVIFKGTAH